MRAAGARLCVSRILLLAAWEHKPERVFHHRLLQHATCSTQHATRSTRGTPHACSWSWKMDGRWSFSAFEYFLPSPSAVSCASGAGGCVCATQQPPLSARGRAGQSGKEFNGARGDGSCPYCRLGKVEVLLILVALPKRTRADTACSAAHSGRDIATNRCFAESRETIAERTAVSLAYVGRLGVLTSRG